MKNLVKHFALLILSLVNVATFAQNFALDLDAVNDKIGVANSTSINPSAALTVEAWINADLWKSSVWAGTIVGKQATSPDRGYCLTAGEGGKAEFTVSIGGIWVSATTPAVMGLNSWYHVAGVFDGSTIKVYINGELQVSNPAVGVISTSSNTMYIGENPTWTGRYFDGTVDEVRIWNVARTQSEIQTNFIAELTLPQTGLVAYYKMNENTGTSVGDATGNGNTGTMLNMDPATDWVPGFVVSAADVGVIGIASPSLLGQGFTNSEKIKVEIKNFSVYPITGFQVSYRLNGGAPVTETVSTTIQPFESYIYTFSGTENLQGQGSATVKAYTSFATDVNYANDTLSNTVTQSLTNVLFNNLQHNFGSYGQINHNIFYMPDSLNDYSQILLHVNLTCPTGGCDPWDQFARISLRKDNEKWELARFITPFGIACGGWTFDITDFREKLTGKVDFESFIQVWGASGWLLYTQIELVPGTPTYKYVKVQKLWDEDNWVYGDPGISYNLPDTLMNVPPNTSALKIRLTNTGHGQGNTNNAAEFFDATHAINVNSAPTFTHHLWKADCGSNSCTAQAGTYTYSRAGWCPGQDVQPAFYDLAGMFTAGGTISLDYVLQSYTNLLNTGYNNGSHTEPFFRVQGYLVAYGNSPLVEMKGNTLQSVKIKAFPNPAKDRITVLCNGSRSGDCAIEMTDVTGKTVVRRYINKPDNTWSEELPLTNIPAGIYVLHVQTPAGVATEKVVVE
ncbi:MAG: LamG-like jellyroll fold domain-containing protein [Bacteroidota bacterium]